jgi:hypothetical protein
MLPGATAHASDQHVGNGGVTGAMAVIYPSEFDGSAALFARAFK